MEKSVVFRFNELLEKIFDLNQFKNKNQHNQRAVTFSHLTEIKTGKSLVLGSVLNYLESWLDSHVNSRLSALVQLLFSFDHRTSKLIKLSCKLSLGNSVSCNSCSCLTRTRELMKLSCKLACQLSCNSCSRLTTTWRLMKLSCKFSLVVNSHATLVLVWPGHEVDETLKQTLACQLSCNSCSRVTRAWELMKLPCKLSLVNSHVTLVLVWPTYK